MMSILVPRALASAGADPGNNICKTSKNILVFTQKLQNTSRLKFYSNMIMLCGSVIGGGNINKSLYNFEVN